MSTKESRPRVSDDVPEELGDTVGDEFWRDNPREDDEESATGSPTPPTSICDLPREVMLDVFSYFSVKELCCQLSLVCQEWNSLSRAPILWQRLELGPHISATDDCPNNLFDVLSRVPLLKSLIIENRSDASKILRVVGLSCPQIQKLQVKNCKNLKEEDIKGIFCGCPSISDLSLEGSALPLTSPSSYQLIARLNKLKVLNLSFCWTLKSESLRFLADNLPSLQELIIDNIMDLTEEDLIYVIDKKKTMLTKLFIEGGGMSDVVYRACAECPELVSFGVTFADQITDVGLNEIAKLDKLSWFKIEETNYVSSNAFECFFKKPSSHKLVHVDISYCICVDDKVLMAIADNCPLLLFLAIELCLSVSDSGIGYLVTKCTKLEYLNISQVRNTTNRVIETIPEHLKNLKYLKLDCCKNEKENVIKEVVSRFPNLEVVDGDGRRIVKGNSSSFSAGE